MNYRFKKKKSQEKTQEDLNLENEIELLEKNIEAMIIAKIDVPEVMTHKLADLKAKLNPNKINAKKFIYNGIEYDSIREGKFAKALVTSGLRFDYQVQIELQPKFSLEKENIQDICIVVDFIVDGQFLVDVKGHIMPVFNIKWKMLKHKYRDTRSYFIIQKDSDIQGFIAYAKTREWKEE